MGNNNNFLILSEPRTGSIHTLTEYCKEYKKTPLPGLLYRPQSGFEYPGGIKVSDALSVKNYTDEEILMILNMPRLFIGHGHWHSMPYYSGEVIEKIKDFKIIDIKRNPLNQLISIILLIREKHPLYKGPRVVGKDDYYENKFSEQQITEGLDLIMDWFFEMKIKTGEAKKQFKIHKTLEYTDIGDKRVKERNKKKVIKIIGDEGLIMLEEKLSSPKYLEIMKKIKL